MDKYKRLKEVLKKIDQDIKEIHFAFDELEREIGTRLPPSAYKYSAWWSNPKSKDYHSYAQSWLQAGWEVAQTDLKKRTVIFRRRVLGKVDAIKNKTDNNLNSNQRDANEGDQAVNDALQILQKIGFEYVGRWYLDGDGLQFQIEKHEKERNVIYAFVAKGSVQYIGKTEKTLIDRMNQYKKPGKEQRTNIKNHKKIRLLLEGDLDVQIFVLLPREKILYKGFPIDLAAGLESSLIATFRPPWNGNID